MPIDVDATIPPEYMHAAALDQVVGFIRALHVFPSVKRQLLARWGYIVGADISPELLQYVQVVNRK